MCGSSPPPRICPPPPLVLMDATLLALDLSPHIPPQLVMPATGGVPQCGGMTRMLKVTPLPSTPPKPLVPRRVPVTPLFPRDRGSSDRCSYPCLSLSPSRETGGAQAAVHTPCTQLIFFMFFFMFFPFSSFPPLSVSLLPPSPLLSLAFLSAFLQGKPALPPSAGATRMGTPTGWGHLLPPV